jgi:hypothetical protein
MAGAIQPFPTRDPTPTDTRRLTDAASWATESVPVDESETSAHSRGGVLKLRLPRTADAMDRELAIDDSARADRRSEPCRAAVASWADPSISLARCGAERAVLSVRYGHGVGRDDAAHSALPPSGAAMGSTRSGR